MAVRWKFMKREDIKKLWENKAVRVCILAFAALLLLFLVWKVFFASSSSAAVFEQTEREIRLIQLLKEIDGIDDAHVLITESEGAVVSAVIVYEGKDEILVRMRILDIASSALNLGKQYVQVYASNA